MAKENIELIKHTLCEGFDKFLEKWCGNSYPHLVDTDDNDGEEFRQAMNAAIDKAANHWPDTQTTFGNVTLLFMKLAREAMDEANMSSLTTESDIIHREDGRKYRVSVKMEEI